ncbi:MAG: hypothetical protein J5661_06510 [Bacteroidaceae bacterium]|nr:hypothetical protein [Bacteroidaceae bacterium]
MKEKMLRSIWLRVCMIVAVVTTAFAGTVWAEIHPIDVEVEGFTEYIGQIQIDGNIAYSTSSDGACYADGVLSAKTITLTASNNAKINSVTFHYTTSSCTIQCNTTNNTDVYYFEVNGFGNEAQQNPIVTDLSCDEIVFKNRWNSDGVLSIDYLKVTYTPGTPEYTITPLSSDESKGTVEVDGNVIIATPNHGYGVDENNPYTIEGEATLTPYYDNEFAVVPSTNCTVTINFVAHAADSKVNFEHNLNSYADWEHNGTIVHSERYQSSNAHGGKYFGITNANTAWMKTKNKIEYPSTFTCYVRSLWSDSPTWKIQVSSTGSDSDWTDVKTYTPSSSTLTSWYEFTADLSLYTDVYVRLYYTGSRTVGAIDDIDLTEATATVKVSVSNSGLSTYCNNRALDFSKSSIKAYYATATGTTLTFHRIYKVPAGFPVLLQKTGGVTDEEVPALVGDAPEITGNVFVRGTGAVVSWSATDQKYILYHDETHEIGFYKANNNKVATNRAYIHLPNGNQVKDFTINLDADDTGIETMRDAQPTANDAIYNLAGQRLKKMQKGINIVNGKKMIQR